MRRKADPVSKEEPAPIPERDARLRVLLPYAFTIFLGAFLLFQIQPLIAKYILPWFGGGPAVWTTAMLFFQVFLLGGYAYAHLSVRWLSPAGTSRIAPRAARTGAGLSSHRPG